MRARNKKRNRRAWFSGVLSTVNAISKSAWSRRIGIGLTVGSLSALVLIFGYRFVTASSHFALAKVEVKGNARLAKKLVVSRSGLRLGENVFDIDLLQTISTLEHNPWIKKAEVFRQLPDTIVVHLSEREPAALAELDGLYLVERNGNPFKRVNTRGRTKGSTKEWNGLPVITGIARADFIDNQEKAQEEIKFALNIAEIYAEKERPQLGEIRVSSTRGVVLHTYEGGTAIRLGRGSLEDIGKRLQVFDQGWNELRPSQKMRAKSVFVGRGSVSNQITVALAAE